jgi:RES domain-containing protein
LSAAAGFAGRLYRALNPVWAADPLSGEGAARHGGRFNPLGVPALYCSVSPHTAIREANQVGDLQPITLVAYRAAIDRVFDCRDEEAVREARLSPDELADPAWREAMRREGEAPTQRFARRLIDEGWAGMLVRSFARGSGADDLNLVLWRWGKKAPARLEVIDDEGRLGPG